MWGDGFRIPYFDLSGKPTGFYRWRHFPATGFLRDAKVQRYAQEQGSGSHVYLPPFVKWSDIAKNPEEPVNITEGEMNSAILTLNGFPAIGLGGDWGFRRKGELFHAELKQFQWQGRQVVICFDSDARTKPQVMAAEIGLARELLHQGAIPLIARVLDIFPDSKTGADDFIVARGKEEFAKEVLLKAQQWEGAEALFEMNREVVFVLNPGYIMRRANNQRMTLQTFRDGVYANRSWEEIRPGRNKTERERTVRVPLPPAWLQSPFRAEVERETYVPGKPQSIRRDGQVLWNTWKRWGVERKAGDTKPWRELIAFLCKKNDEEIRYFQQWLAYPLQNPGAKLKSAVMTFGGQGTGKSLVGETMGKIYGENYTEINNRDLEGPFNPWDDGRQFIMGTEIGYGSSRGPAKRALADFVKFVITRTRKTINRKHIATYEVPDCANFYFTSNHPDALYLEDDDRRLFVIETPATPLEHEFYKHYAQWMESEEGPAALFDYLLKLDLTGFNPNAHAPMTSAKREMIRFGKSDVETWVAELRDNPDQVLGPHHHQLLTTSALLKIYDPEEKKPVSETGMGLALKKGKVLKLLDGAQIPLKSGKQARLWAVRNVEYWRERNSSRFRKEMARQYEEEHGLNLMNASVSKHSSSNACENSPAQS